MAANTKSFEELIKTWFSEETEVKAPETIELDLGAPADSDSAGRVQLKLVASKDFSALSVLGSCCSLPDQTIVAEKAPKAKMSTSSVEDSFLSEESDISRHNLEADLSMSVGNSFSDSVASAETHPQAEAKVRQLDKLSLEDARELLCGYVTAHPVEPGERGGLPASMLYLPCLEENTESLRALGAYWNGTTLFSFSMSSTGPVNVHQESAGNIDIISKSASALCSCSYHVYESPPVDAVPWASGDPSSDAAGPPTDGDRPCSKVTVDCRWSGSTGLLQKPPPSAHTLLTVQFPPGDSKSAASTLYTQLRLVSSYLEALRTGQIHWVGGSGGTHLLQDVQRLIQEASQLHHHQAPSTEEKDFELHARLIAERVDLDFTEELWLVLTRCSSYSDLRQALQTVVDAAKRDDFQPLVHHSNRTGLAQHIRASYHDRQRQHMTLDGLTPLKLLLELGIAKLRRDYLNFFITQEYVAVGELAYLAGQQEDLELEEQVERLGRLHHLLELAVGTRTFLPLPRQDVRSLVRLGLKFYQEHTSTSTSGTSTSGRVQAFTLSVEASLLQSIFESCHPSWWRTTWVSSDHSLTIHQLSAQPLQDLSPHPTTGLLNGNDSNDFEYYVTRITREPLI